jgi:hypothetical protein
MIKRNKKINDDNNLNPDGVMENERTASRSLLASSVVGTTPYILNT